jgi:hypothetical protein
MGVPTALAWDDMKYPLSIFIESSNKQRSADYNVDICIHNAVGHERFHSRHNNDDHLCYHIKPPGTPTKTILIRIPCHNYSRQDAVASTGFNSALIQKLTVAPKLCYQETCPPALRIPLNSLQMMYRTSCKSNSRFCSLYVWLFKDISLIWEMQTKFYSETLKRRHFL